MSSHTEKLDEQYQHINTSVLVPPNAVDVEQTLLGSLLINNKDYDLISDKLSASDFYLQANKIIYEVMTKMVNAGDTTDIFTVNAQIEKIGKSEEVGGLAYLHKLTSSGFSFSESKTKSYAKIIKDRSVRRQLIAIAQEISASGFSTDDRDTESLLADAEKKILEIGVRGSSTVEYMRPIADDLDSYMEELQRRSECPNEILGVQTGFEALDAKLNGLQPGDLVVIGGRPSMGKTALAMNIVEHAGTKQDLPVLVISLEMSRESLLDRLAGSITGLDLSRSGIRKKQLTNDDWTSVGRMYDLLKTKKIEVQDMGAETVSQIRSAARRGARKHQGLGLIVIDYLQLLDSDHKSKLSSENRASEISKMSRGLKLLAKEMKCPVIALSQLNRSLENRPDKRPQMSDLRESGAIEQDADIILFLYRDEYYTREACKELGIAEVHIAKQRNGPTGTVRLGWEPTVTRFTNL